MRRRIFRGIAVIGIVLVLASPADARARRPTQTKAQAEVNVLRAVARNWSHKRISALIDPVTQLVANNTQAVCHGRGRRVAHNRYRRFVCVVRPRVHVGREGLYVSYRVLRHGRFRVHWLRYRSR